MFLYQDHNLNINTTHYNKTATNSNKTETIVQLRGQELVKRSFKMIIITKSKLSSL